MTTATKQNVNDMIYKTLKTKADKPAKYADKLRELGYTVENDEWNYRRTEREPRTYWAVNDLEVSKWEGETAQLSLGRGQYINKFENIKKVDFVDYLAKRDERKAKAERMNAHDAIEQHHKYWKDEREFYIAEDGTEYRWYKYGCRREVRRYRKHSVVDFNHTVNEYKQLKRKAEARGYSWRDEADSEIRFAERWLADAENRVEKLWEELEKAEKEVERRKADVQKAIDRKAEGGEELNAWLVAKGIRVA